WQLHPVVLQFARSGSLMISKTIHIPKPQAARPGAAARIVGDTGGLMANASSPGDLDSMARQYWDTWSGLMGMGPAGSGTWTGLGGMAPGQPAPAAFDWYARMQEVAAQFADGGGSAADIAGAWRQMLGGQDGNPFSSFFQGMPGAFGAATVGWPDQVRPFVDAILRPLRQQASGWFGQPGLGPAREHQQRLQALAAAWQEWEERN